MFRTSAKARACGWTCQSMTGSLSGKGVIVIARASHSINKAAPAKKTEGFDTRVKFFISQSTEDDGPDGRLGN
jgi:hypothetical protein